MQIDLSHVITVVIALGSAAASYGGGVVRDSYQDRDITALQRSLEMERNERLAYQTQRQQERIAWLLQRSDRRLDPNLSAVATTGATLGAAK